ncbi:hypothetical protein SAMN05421579_1202 [Xenorhabdus japonica]|uniref:Uncharacterized protein n=1 Tax=Xenorhabdus japonica TaxID=53341 RepID=A0A1I5BKR9_9GAMM|nr:hypothetical protein SAMN05421579_1202 [Xenorhabdus japonica]
MQFNIKDIRNIFYPLCPVVTRSIQNNMGFLRKRIRFPDCPEKIRDVFSIDARIFTDHRVFNALSIEGTQNIETGTTAGGFDHFYLIFSCFHPAIAELCVLGRMHRINK